MKLLDTHPARSCIFVSHSNVRVEAIQIEMDQRFPVCDLVQFGIKAADVTSPVNRGARNRRYLGCLHLFPLTGLEIPDAAIKQTT